MLSPGSASLDVLPSKVQLSALHEKLKEAMGAVLLVEETVTDLLSLPVALLLSVTVSETV